MKKWIIGILVAIALLISGKYAFSFIYNAYLTNEYESEKYYANVEPLYFVNCFEPYVAYYNDGNFNYQQGDYKEAIEDYEEALALSPPEDKECSIRINLALAMIYNMGEDYASPDKIESSIETLKEARDILLENGCASDDGKGHNETAQQLKEEIDALIEQLEQQQQQQDPNNENSDNNQGSSGQSEEDEYEEDLKEELLQNQAEAQEEREDNLESYEDIEWSSDYNGIW